MYNRENWKSVGIKIGNATPKEKATELVETYYHEMDGTGDMVYWEDAINRALICTGQVLENIIIQSEDTRQLRLFWEEVRKEIKCLK